MDDLISREATLEAFADYVAHGMSMNDYDALWDIVAKMPSVNPQANNEDIHREREQAYMKGYEDASKRYRTEPCKDAISRSEAIRVASGYCHWTNIPKELAKLPSVNPIPCEDAISRQMAIDALNDMSKNYEKNGKREYHPHIDFVIDVITMLPSVSTEKTGRWIAVENEEMETIGYYCSECDLPMETEEKTDYCPNCGAKMIEPHCGNCKFCGEVLKDNIHSCNNNKSIFKACLETATGCEKFEPQER